MLSRDQELRNFDPFLMLDEFKVTPPAGFPDHPHRGSVLFVCSAMRAFAVLVIVQLCFKHALAFLVLVFETLSLTRC